MKIFFTANLIESDYLQKENILRINNFLSNIHRVTDGHIFKKDNLLDYQNIFKRIKEVNLFIAEVSNFTSEIGYQISIALELKKAITLLYTGKEPTILKKSAKLLSSEKIQVIDYDPRTLDVQLKFALNLSKTQIDKRFTILLPPKLVDYLDNVARKNRIPRSAYIRQLIEKESHP